MDNLTGAMDIQKPVDNNAHLEGQDDFVTDIFIQVPWIRYSLVSLNILAVVLGAIANGTALYAITKDWKRHQHNVTSYLVLNLIITEFIRSVFHQPIRLVDILLHEKLFLRSDLAFCKISRFLTAFFAGVAFHTIVGIALERFLLFCFPLRSKGWITTSRTLHIIVGIWIVALFATMPLPVFSANLIVLPFESANISFCLIDVSYQNYNVNSCHYFIALFVLYYALPVLVITACYVCIFHTLRREIPGIDVTDGTVIRQRATRNSLAKMMLAIAIIFTIFHGPYFLVILSLCLGAKVRHNAVFLLMIIEFLPQVSSVLNPFIYAAHSGFWPLKRHSPHTETEVEKRKLCRSTLLHGQSPEVGARRQVALTTTTRADKRHDANNGYNSNHDSSSHEETYI